MLLLVTTCQGITKLIYTIQIFFSTYVVRLPTKYTKEKWAYKVYVQAVILWKHLHQSENNFRMNFTTFSNTAVVCIFLKGDE